MTATLLDVNVVLALIDPNHRFNGAAAKWLFADPARNWCTSPTIENSAIRIAMSHHYPNERTPEAVASALLALTNFGKHERLPEEASLLDSRIDHRRLRSAKQVTDTYLALLAHTHGVQLATFDRRLSTAALTVPVKIFQLPA